MCNNKEIKKCSSAAQQKSCLTFKDLLLLPLLVVEALFWMYFIVSVFYKWGTEMSWQVSVALRGRNKASIGGPRKDVWHLCAWDSFCGIISVC